MKISSGLYRISFQKRIPLDVVLELTSNCNLRCRHCYFGKFLNKGNYMEFRGLRKLLQDLKRAGAFFLSFTGGEPLLRDDFFKISIYARKLNFDIRIFTNGTLIARKEAEDINKIGFSSVEVSIYGGRETTHDFFTSVKGSFKRTLKGVENLRKEGVSVYFKVLVMKKNLGELDEIRRIARFYRAKLRFDPLVSAGYGFNKKPLRYRLGEKDIADFILRKMPGRVKEYPVCGAGRNIVGIGFKGDVYPCLLLPLSFGNIRKESFLRIWDRMNSFEFEYCKDCRLRDRCFYCPGIVYFEKRRIGVKFNIFCNLTMRSFSL